MADPEFYDNRGPFTLAAVCVAADTLLPQGADGAALLLDLAGLDGAGAGHLSFFAGGRDAAAAFARSAASFCFVPAANANLRGPAGMVVIPAPHVTLAFARAAALFYPEAGLARWSQVASVDPAARLAPGVVLAPGAVIAAGAEIGEGTRIGAGAAIGPGVAIGRNCEIGAQVSISHAYIGDRVAILPGAQIGQSGFGFASSPAGHVKIPQLGRVIIQDDVEVGAGTTIDRGALGDTVIGEGTKIDNLVQIAHNVHIGRHCILVSQSGMAGSSAIGDFVIVGGQVGIADHARVGSGARLAARTGCVPGQVLEGGRDYGGVPAKPVRDWHREIHAVKRLARPRRQVDDE